MRVPVPPRDRRSPVVLLDVLERSVRHAHGLAAAVSSACPGSVPLVRVERMLAVCCRQVHEAFEAEVSS